MLPTLLEIGPIKLHSYGLMTALAFLTALYLMCRDAKKWGIDPQVISDLAFWSLLLGVVSTRVLHILLFPSNYSWRDPIGWIAIWRGGLVFQGAVPTVVLLCWYGLRRRNTGFWRTADAVMPYVPLAHAVGRIGCILNGCCYGRRTDLPWAFPFRRVPWDLAEPATGSPAFVDHCRRYAALSPDVDRWSYPVHPTQVYSIVALVGICLLLLLLRKKWRPFEGAPLPAYLFLYGVARFVIEFFRGDHNPTHVFSFLSDQQVYSLGFAAVGAAMFVIVWRWDLRRRGRDA